MSTQSSILSDILVLLYLILRNCWGIIAHPFQTFKRLSRTPQVIPATTLLLASSLYFIFRAPLILGLSSGLIPLIIQGVIGIIISISSYFLVTFLILSISRLFTKEPNTYLPIYATWIYSYIPTIFWFAATAIAFIALPPPRQHTLPGITFSVVYTVFSLTMLGWKLLLLWFTFRLAANLNHKQTFLAMCLLIPTLVIYSYFLLKLGLWRIPFL